MMLKIIFKLNFDCSLIILQLSISIIFSVHFVISTISLILSLLFFLIMFSELLNKLETVCHQADLCFSIRPSPQSEATNINEFPNANAISFTKSQRFPHSKEQSEQTPLFLDASTVPKSAFSFQKKDRFQPTKEQYLTPLNPNYQAVKANAPSAVICKDLRQSTVSTAPSEVSPATYFTKTNQKVLQGLFPKGKRFAPPKPNYEDTPLFISQTQTKIRPPTAALLKNPIQKTRHIISLEQQRQLQQKIKLIYWRSIPLELDRLYKKNIGPVLRQEYFNIKRMKGTSKKCAIIHFLSKLNQLRGGYQHDITTASHTPCAVIYRKSVPKPFKPQQIEPGPAQYYPKDDMLYPTLPTPIMHEPPAPKPPQIDKRDYNLPMVQPTHNVIIAPLPTIHKLSEEQLMRMNRGPGYYDCLYKQTQAREGLKVVKMQPITAANQRQNNCVEIKEVNDGLYFPKYPQHISVPLYKEPTTVAPPHPPDKVLFPEHWQFYDVRGVRAELAKNVLLAGGMDYKEYQQYVQKYRLFRAMRERENVRPEVGLYTVKYPDAHVETVHMRLQQEKTLMNPIEKIEKGDTLILRPHPVQEHIQGVDFGKLVSREEKEREEDGDVLILHPQKPKQKIQNILFQHMVGRIEEDVEDNVEGDVLILQPREVQTHVAGIDFQKISQRKEQNIQKQQQEIVINIQQKKKCKGMPFSKATSLRFRLIRKNKQDRQ